MTDSPSSKREPVTVPDRLYPSNAFPARRLRRNRSSAAVRDLTAEVVLRAADLILPMFVHEGARESIAHLPGVERLSLDDAVEKARRAKELGIRAVMLFPVLSEDQRDDEASEASNPDSLMCRASLAIREAVPDLMLMADVALDPYTRHGHDGVVIDGDVDNDTTIAVLAQQAVCLASAGFDTVAPSDMMDGRIGVIRRTLDDYGFESTRILSYAAKYASVFYGPFRSALKSEGRLQGDKKTYQLDPANAREALMECELDLAEGADMLMIKPGLPYLDILYRVTQALHVPVFSYQVSGEYALIQQSASVGLDPLTVLEESLVSIRRAGARAVVTYGAIPMAQRLKERS